MKYLSFLLFFIMSPFLCLHANSVTNAAQCITNSAGQKACGFNCVNYKNRIACGKSPAEFCVADNLARIACGYGCVRTSLNAACAERRDNNCVVNIYNELRCGKNCKVDKANRITCEQ